MVRPERVEVVERQRHPARRAMASRCTTALVEQPVAIATVAALLTEARRHDQVGRQVLPDHADDAAAASADMRMWLASGAGIEEAPGSVSPMASAIAVMVEAVPMVMQWP